ncbi:MAG: type II toxin-antitoxin system HicB family antitoxin [Thermoprotei archaeon]|nr:MAG: type II toxin-antitoxin system HicB family antitoxin [Thermoprotei archaeon]RLE98899.1 MAG: type II toxin-antitoxin system HicB family antitoxin [Thermoprotei archaeon]HDI74403.1 type II toxin-antitoxin system HicB family antitoxin [Thermoprotei archaeon]
MAENYEIIEVKATVWREEDMYVIREVITGVTTQGKTLEEALKNLKEALELYLEEKPEAVKDLTKVNYEYLGVLDVKIAAPIRTRSN